MLGTLEELSTLCISDSYLGRVLSAHGVHFANLPSLQSILYWPFVAQALTVIVKEHRNLARLIASGGTDGDDVRAALADLLEDSTFIASCQLVLCVAKPLGEALAGIAATQDLVGYPDSGFGFRELVATRADLQGTRIGARGLLGKDLHGSWEGA